MTAREQFNAVMGKKIPSELPLLEWAMWWDKTVDIWCEQGLERGLSNEQMQQHFGLVRQEQFWLSHKSPDCPKDTSHGSGIIKTMEDYEAIKPFILPNDAVDRIVPRLMELAEEHEKGNLLIWYTLDGFFWWPRVLFGIEAHLFSFYDEPELYHIICEDLLSWQIKMVDQIAEYVKPDFMTIAEDMSYNHGPMVSKEMYEEFIAPYYKRLIPEIKKHNTRVIVDSDGDIMSVIPWMISCGVDGALPLERQSHVDIAKIREAHPDFLMIGGFDKMAMLDSKESIKKEVERILPTIRSGGYWPAMDHQTPPGTPLENYRYYLSLLKEAGKQTCADCE